MNHTTNTNTRNQAYRFNAALFLDTELQETTTKARDSENQRAKRMAKAASSIDALMRQALFTTVH